TSGDADFLVHLRGGLLNVGGLEGAEVVGRFEAFVPGVPDMKTLSHMYRDAWHKGLKTTYYLRTLQASNIEKATTKVNKEVRISAGDAPKKEYTEAEKQQCSLDALINGEECEACQ
ncbi:MAG: hypothetical protein AAF733_01320, partial [Verrucomicrobiota bacterium]